MNRIKDFIPLIEDAISNDKQIILPVYGQSMEPLLHSKDSVVLVGPKDLKKNDMILYKRSDETYIFHRIYRIKNNCYSLLGDHQINEEYPVLQSAVIAKAIGYYVNNKYFNIKHFKYRLYLLIWRSKLIRRIYFKLLKKKQNER